MIYYFVLEGCWGASLGKRLMGLRVTLARRAAAGGRALACAPPCSMCLSSFTLFFMLAPRADCWPRASGIRRMLRRADGLEPAPYAWCRC